MLFVLYFVIALAVGAPKAPPSPVDEAEEPWMDDGGLVDLGPPGAELPAHWRPELSVRGRRQAAETTPGRGPWTACIAAPRAAGLSWERACEAFGRGTSEVDLHRRRAVHYAGPGCTGAARPLPGDEPEPERVPEALQGSLILRCVASAGSEFDPALPGTADATPP